MYYIEKTIEVAGCHRLALPYQSKCENMHGHNWIITIYCKSEQLTEYGMVIDFTEIKNLIHKKLDHKNFNELFEFNPTAENIAKWICEQIDCCYKVKVIESENNVAIYEEECIK